MESKNLKTSKFAPRTPAESLALSRTERVKQEKDKASRLFNRLRWKAQLLTASYNRALEMAQGEDSAGNKLLFINGMTSKQAESMFKIDFFEFYTLLERFLTLSLSVLGVSISSNGPRTNVNALRFVTNREFARSRVESTHQFHANLLEALDEKSSPLHPALGHQDIRIQLARAKDYRNHWKDADDQSNKSSPGVASTFEPNVRLLDLELEKMLITLLIGCEQALEIVHVDTRSSDKEGPVNSRDFEPRAYEHTTMEMDDVPLEYMDDAMDLD